MPIYAPDMLKLLLGLLPLALAVVVGYHAMCQPQKLPKLDGIDELVGPAVANKLNLALAATFTALSILVAMRAVGGR